MKIWQTFGENKFTIEETTYNQTYVPVALLTYKKKKVFIPH